MPMPDLRLEIGGTSFQNPVMVASGTFGYGREYAEFVDLSRLGAVMVKGVSLEPWAGNRPPRMAETPCGMLNAIGLQNPGVDHFLREDLPFLREAGAAVVVNIVGRTVEEYAGVAARLDGAAGIAAVEVNISCPNIKEGGISFGTDPQAAAAVVRAVKEATRLPVIPKLAPNVTDPAAVASAVVAAGADAISATNTFLGMAIDIERQRPVLPTVFGGLSGPAIKPLALRVVWEIYEAVDVPIIGMGGISSAADALEFMLAGASAIAVGTANFVNPVASLEVLAGIESFFARRGIARLAEWVGAAHR
ncbi:MAG TPA: dihydroorotate dehydrogenase [Limnochordia bacterium]